MSRVAISSCILVVSLFCFFFEQLLFATSAENNERICVLEARFDEPVLITYLPDVCIFSQAICSSDLATLSVEKEDRFNWLTKKVRTTDFVEQTRERHSGNLNKACLQRVREGGVATLVPNLNLPPMLLAYANKIPLVWCLKGERDFVSICNYFKKIIEVYRLEPVVTNKLLVIIEDGVFFEQLFSLRDKIKKKTAFSPVEYCFFELQKYFDLVEQKDEKDYYLRLREKALEKIASTDLESFSLIYNSLKHNLFVKAQELVKQIGASGSFSALVILYFLSLLKEGGLLKRIISFFPNQASQDQSLARS